MILGGGRLKARSLQGKLLVAEPSFVGDIVLAIYNFSTANKRRRAYGPALRCCVSSFSFPNERFAKLLLTRYGAATLAAMYMKPPR